MIIYRGTKEEFSKDLVSGVLESKLEDLLVRKLGRRTPENEKWSWTNSLTYMNGIMNRIPDDVGVALEYNIPYTSKRVDLIVSGLDYSGNKTAVIIELKQWKEVESVPEKDGIVKVRNDKGSHETTHPSYQAWSYATAIWDFNADVQDSGVAVLPCACLHNYKIEGDKESDPLVKSYKDYIDLAPIYTKLEGQELQKFLSDKINRGNGLDIISLLDSGRLRPSKSLQDAISSMMKGNREFIMLDMQKVVFENVLHAARDVHESGEKRTIIVKGGPGTGKTVVAINLLAQITAGLGFPVIYVSKNRAPRYVYRMKLKGEIKDRRVENLFKGSGGLVYAGTNQFDVILADESHRLIAKEHHYQGNNQVKDIIKASKLSVFFIDEDQRVTLGDIGTIDEIERCARDLGSEVSTFELESQFRCMGSDGYLEWLDDALQIRESINLDPDIGIEYDFRVFDDPCVMRDEIRELNGVNDKSRLVAGYCWDWVKANRNDGTKYDVIIPEFDFKMSWNLDNTNTWAIDAGSIDQIGCIHTCQGLEFDYVGVILGPDIRYEAGQVITDYTKRAKTDRSLWGLKSKYQDKAERYAVANKIIKNTYRVLMSRGMKGCFVYCTDKGMADHLRKLSEESFRQDV